MEPNNKLVSFSFVLSVKLKGNVMTSWLEKYTCTLCTWVTSVFVKGVQSLDYVCIKKTMTAKSHSEKNYSVNWAENTTRPSFPVSS